MEKTKEIAMYSLAGLITTGFFTILGLLIAKGIPTENAELLNMSIGALLVSFSVVVSYFFGSSAGSKAKTELLGKK